jgi:hypothetical protein
MFILVIAFDLVLLYTTPQSQAFHWVELGTGQPRGDASGA